MADISLNSAALDQGTFFWGGEDYSIPEGPQVPNRIRATTLDRIVEEPSSLSSTTFPVARYGGTYL